MALVPARAGDPRTADTTWVLTVSGASTSVRLRGPLIALAWLAHLADWDEPPSA